MGLIWFFGFYYYIIFISQVGIKTIIRSILVITIFRYLIIKINYSF